MKIAKVEAIPYEIPMIKPLKFASGEMTKADHVLIRLTTDDGIVGVADVPPRPYTYGETQESIIAIVTKAFAPILVGENPFARERIQRGLLRTIGNFGAKGAIDIAVWDIIGQSLGQPVHQLLGGYTDAVYACHMVGFAPPQEMVDEAMMYREKYGITTFKVKVGRRPVDLDVEACIALREHMGPDTTLYLDANRGWSANEALAVARRLADYDFLYLEEPNDALELMGRHRLVTDSPIAIFADESTPSLGAAARELVTGGASGVSIKTARTGFTESQKIAGLCEGLGVDVIMGNQIDSMHGSFATVTFGAAHESTSRRAAELSNFMDFADTLIAENLEITGGKVAVPTVPGVGATIDEDKLAHYRRDER